MCIGLKLAVNRVTEEQGRLMPLDDLLSMDTESNDNQSHCVSGFASMDVIHTEEPGAVHESEVVCSDIDNLQCSPVQHVDEYCRNDGFFSKVNSHMEPLQVEQRHSTNETCAEVVPLAGQEPYICLDSPPETDGVFQECSPTSVNVLEPVNGNCVTDVEQHYNTNATCAEVVPLADQESYICCNSPPETDNVLQECSATSADVRWPENESCITYIAEIEIEDDRSDAGTSALVETDSDCVIQDVLGGEASDCYPSESECEMTVDSLSYDHSYSLPIESVQHSVVTTGGIGICPEYSSQAGVTFSVPSLQAHDFNVATVLPFPSLITDPDIDKLCSYKQSHIDEHAVTVTRMELMDTGASGASDLGDESDCLVLENSSYPVVEIVPRYDEEEVEGLESSGMPSHGPCTSANTTNLSTVADDHSANMSSTDIAAPTSRRAKASKVTFVRSYSKPLKLFFI